MQAASLNSVLDNYEVHMGVWEESKESHFDSDTRARVTGVETQMQSFDFLYGVSLDALILNHSDNLSKILQHVVSDMSAAEGQQVAKLTCDVLKSIREAEHFQSFYKRVLLHLSKLDIDSLQLIAPTHVIRGQGSLR